MHCQRDPAAFVSGLNAASEDNELVPPSHSRRLLNHLVGTSGKASLIPAETSPACRQWMRKSEVGGDHTMTWGLVSSPALENGQAEILAPSSSLGSRST